MADYIDREAAEWVPVYYSNDGWGGYSHPMPRPNRMYLVTYRTPKGKLYVRDLFCSWVELTPKYIGWSKRVKGKIIAWMELPKPYENGEVSEEQKQRAFKAGESSDTKDSYEELLKCVKTFAQI